MGIKRFKEEGVGTSNMEQCSLGGWVSYEDHVAEVSRHKEEIDLAKRCLPCEVMPVQGSWVGSVQNYISTLADKLEELGVNPVDLFSVEGEQ